jgi:orotidine-5'-phosphate decarboxylase
MAELIVALDVPDAAAAQELMKRLRSRVTWFKIGLELFTAAGPALIADLKSAGCKVFLDLKYFDIPNTVRGAVRSATNLGVDMLTLHCIGGRTMSMAALQGRSEASTAGSGPLLLGVTLLTSMTPADLPGNLTQDSSDMVLDLASQAEQWGLDGVVCSGMELGVIRSHLPSSFLCLTPGIRLPDGREDDQKRVVTPQRAVHQGSDFLVVGRPISGSTDPAAEADRFLSAMGQSSGS